MQRTPMSDEFSNWRREAMSKSESSGSCGLGAKDKATEEWMGIGRKEKAAVKGQRCRLRRCAACFRCVSACCLSPAPARARAQQVLNRAPGARRRPGRGRSGGFRPSDL